MDGMRALNPSERRLIKIIDQLGFGCVEGLWIQQGQPCFTRAPRIVQEIKLGSETDRSGPPSDRPDGNFTPKKEFESLFGQLSGISDGIVDIDVRHSLPFRVIRERCLEEFLP